MDRPNIWITSDTHFNHVNLIEGTSNWTDKSGCRPFKSLKEHDETIIENINKYVKEDDILWHLGDFSFNGIENIWNFRKRVNCKNIHFILGNHDHHIERNNTIYIDVEDALVFSKISGITQPFIDDREPISCRSLFSSTQYVATEKFFGQTVFMSHYAHRVWNKSHKGRIHLYGHSHDTIADQGRSMDVGLESAYRLLGQWRPFKWQEIQKIMTHRDISFVDHHNEKTN